MTGIPPEYLQYRARKYGMDHDRYDWSILPRRKKVEWPGGARVALWVMPALEWFPIDMKGKPFKPPGAMQTSYPDLRHYTLRDYGNRVGIWRMMRSFDRLYEEGEHSGTVMCIPLHPYLVGWPYRMKAFEDALRHITGHDKVWLATGREIAQHFTAHHMTDFARASHKVGAAP